MRRLIAVLIILGLFIQPVNVMAMPTEYSGGVNNEYEYQEYVFLSGEPVKYTGTYKITETNNTGKKTVSYRFTLAPEDKNLKGKLDRQMTYTTTYTNRNDKGQTIAQTVLTKMQESVDIGGTKYDLKNYQFSQSDIIDNRPVSNFYSGNIKGRKYYAVNSSQGQVIVDISGGDVGYDNFWGNTGTQIIDYVISADVQVAASTGSSSTTGTTSNTGSTSIPVSWQGTVKVQVSDSTTQILNYSDNEAAYSSFQGGFMKVTNREMVSKYEYDLPKMDSGKPVDTARKVGTAELNQKMLPKVQRLIVPKFRDVGGHWAENYINELYSLDVFDDTAQFFLPNISMTRAEFTKAVMKACNIRPTVDTRKKTTVSRSKTPEVSKFSDIAVNDPDYQYIKDAVNKGIILGTSNVTFMPKGPLTRAQAALVLIRALGFDTKAPTPGFTTAFDDDSKIPGWAKDSIYVAKELGLLQGDDNNRFNADKPLTRAEASALLVKFLEFLQKDLQKDYRENIMLYN